MRHFGWWVGIPAVLLAGGLLAGCSKHDSAAAAPPHGGMPPIPVEAAVVERTAIGDKLQAVGTVTAEKAITVVSEIDGTVMSLPFPEGGRVHQGDLLAQIDDSQLKAEVDRAAALRDQSKATYERVKEVVAAKAGAPQDLDDAAASLKVAEANLALAQARLAKTRVTAPFEGYVGARKVSPGTFLRAGDPITDLARIDELRVDFSAPERYVPLLHPGEKVVISTPAWPGEVVEGTIAVVEPVLDPVTRETLIVARVANPEGHLRPGMSADVTATLNERTDALAIPNEAVFVEGNQSLVYQIKSDSTVARVPLTLGTRLADVVEVVQGLKAGDEVVRAGHQKLFEGARVQPIVSQPGAGGSDLEQPGGGQPGPGQPDPASPGRPEQNHEAQ